MQLCNNENVLVPRVGFEILSFQSCQIFNTSTNLSLRRCFLKRILQTIVASKLFTRKVIGR